MRTAAWPLPPSDLMNRYSVSRFPELLQDLVHRHDVVVTDGPPRVVPVRNERRAEDGLDLRDEMLGLVEEDRRLLDALLAGS
jgi:hypothetical protein